MGKIFHGYGPGERGLPPQGLNETGTADALSNLTNAALDRMADLLVMEKGRRLAQLPPVYRPVLREMAEVRDRIDPWRLENGWRAFANFLLGTAQAMAARAALRASRGHVPFAELSNPHKVGKLLTFRSGGTPASGKDWHADDGAALERLVITNMPIILRGQTWEFTHNPLLMKADAFKRRYVQGQGQLLARSTLGQNDAQPSRFFGVDGPGIRLEEATVAATLATSCGARFGIPSYANPGPFRVSER